jgi:hypothetical protein
MMKIEKIVMKVKQTRWQEVEFSEGTGHEMPETANDLVKMCEEIKDDPFNHVSEGDWAFDVDNVVIKSFAIVEAD